MVVIWGKRVARSNAGTIDWFCPVCRAVGAHRLVDVRKYTHIYFIPAERGQFLFREAVCNGCRLATAPEPFQPAARGGAAPDIVGIDTGELSARRMELEERLIDGRVDAAERAWLIAEPIAALEHSVVSRGSPGQSVNALIGLGAIVLIFAAVIVVFDQGWSMVGSSLTAGAAAFLLGWVWHTARMNGGGRRQRLAAILAQSLEILQPTEEEIARATEALADKGLTAPKLVSPRAVVRAIERRARIPVAPA
jgi:hypothetical protein